MIEKIGKYFLVNYGQKQYHNKSKLLGNIGNNILISSAGENNGIYGFYDIKNNYKAPFISVPSTGTIGQAFVQLIDCSVDDNCLVLIPKEKMTIEQLYQIAYQIRQTKWKYKYGRQITPQRLEEQEIVLEKNNFSFDKLYNELIPKESSKVNITENKNIKIMKVIDLCDPKKKKAKPQNVLINNGNVPYVTTTSYDNGVSLFVDEKPNSKAKSLTVAMNGSVGEVFFQTEDFITSSDNAVLTLKGKYNPYLLFYIGALIKNHKWRYNYYRKMSMDKLKNLELPIPYRNNEIDFDYIEKIVKNCYGFNELKLIL